MLATLVLFTACGSDPTEPPPPPTALAFVSAPGGSTTILAPLVPAPVVELRDAENHTVKKAGIQVTASLDVGSVSGTAIVTTDASGRATFGTLALSGSAGVHQLRFSAAGLTTLSRSITLLAGTATQLTARSALSQSASVGQAVSDPPAVLVSDNVGNPVAGVMVSFTVTAGGGSLQGANPVSNASGVATVTSWTLGATQGTNTVTAALTGSAPITFTATALPPQAPFRIEIQHVGSPTSAETAAVAAAVQRWQEVIVGDLPDHAVELAAGSCFPEQPAVSTTVDDIRVLVAIDSIDGLGGILGSAGPCLLRAASGLPSLGAIHLDSADLGTMTQNELNDLMRHEMAHVLGFGTLWPDQALISDPCPETEGATICSTDPRFTGGAGIAGYHALGGLQPNVPVENTGGPGTWNSHWRETVFQNELMTGFIGGEPNPLTGMTIGAMADLGYVVDYSTADPLGFTPAGLRQLRAPSRRLAEQAFRGPILVADAGGRTVGQRPRQ